jgi:hypothetical protein
MGKKKGEAKSTEDDSTDIPSSNTHATGMAAQLHSRKIMPLLMEEIENDNMCSELRKFYGVGPARGPWTNLGRLPLRVFSIGHGKYAFQKK